MAASYSLFVKVKMAGSQLIDKHSVKELKNNGRIKRAKYKNRKDVRKNLLIPGLINHFMTPKEMENAESVDVVGLVEHGKHLRGLNFYTLLVAGI